MDPTFTTMKKMPKRLLLTLCLFAVSPWSRADDASSGLQAPVAFTAIAISSASEVSADAAPGVSIAGLPALEQAAFKAELKRLIGQPLTRDNLQALIAMVNAQLAASGESFSVASLPEQDISAGQIQVRITRATVGRLTFKNTGDWKFSQDYYRALFRIQTGDALTANKLDDEVDWISRSNPYRSAQVLAEPGQQIGQTDLEISISEQRPYSFSLGYENNGSRVTGRDRFTFTAGWGQVLGLDHQLNYSLNANQNFNKFQSHTLGYVIPLPWHYLLSLSVNASQIKPELPEPFNQSGSSSGLSVRIDAPLPRRGAYTHGVNLAFDYKRSDNSLLFSQTPVTNTQTAIYQFNLGYKGTLKDGYGQTVAHGNWIYAPGNVGSNNDDAAFSATRAQAKAAYSYWQLGLERTTQLPKDWKWTINANFQGADSNLLGSEQLSGGGVASVRGFADAIAFGDEGRVLRTELLSPFFQAEPLGQAIQLQGLVFYDDATLNNKQLLPGEAASNRLHAWGLGLRLSLPKNVTVRIDAGKQINHDVVGATPESLVHIGLSASF